jgi:hypothetical protein
LIELRCDLIAKEPTGATGANSPSVDIFGIRPHQIAKGTLVRNLLCARDDADLIDGADLGTQAAMDAKNLSVDNGSEDEEVEYVAACFPHGCVAVLLLAFFVEAVYLGNLP